MDVEELMKISNAVKEEVLRALEKDGHLKKPAAEIAEEYVIVVSERTWLGKLFQKAKEKDEDKGLRIYAMKIV
jgi:hypothetical protein